MEVLQEMNNAEIMQRAMDDCREVQEYMATAKEENAEDLCKIEEEIYFPESIAQQSGR